MLPRRPPTIKTSGPCSDSPQLWLTTAFHLGTGLPWDWRIGPTDSSEREHLRQMLATLPAGALVVADAGFVGDETWEAIRSGGRHLLVRVGANVRLLRGLGSARERDGLVYLRPDRQAARGRPPLVLRPVVARGPRHPVYLVTSAPDEATLSDRQVVELYRLRWGVEVCQADDIPSCGLYPSARSAHSERGGAAGPGPLVPGAPSRCRRATAMRSDGERPAPPRPRAA